MRQTRQRQSSSSEMIIMHLVPALPVCLVYKVLKISIVIIEKNLSEKQVYMITGQG
jgi:hypothetical protein